LTRRTRVKICGVTSVDDALLAADAGADAVGMILYAPGARRQIDANTAREIVAKLPPYVSAVGVFRDCPATRVRQVLFHVPIDTVQFHGKETPQLVRGIQPSRAMKVLVGDSTLPETAHQWAQAIVPNLTGLLIDAPGGGGTGTPNDWEAVASLDLATLPPVTLAGGLTPETVGDVVRRLRPWAVDVSSGVEEDDGRKSPQLVRDFIAAVDESQA
jgi:phosphoribosylanthranilate isomerase